MTDEIELDGWLEKYTQDTPIAWFHERMAESGITEPVARACGFQLKVGDLGAYFTLPFFTIDGVPTTYVKKRMRDSRIWNQGTQQYSGGGTKGKYVSPSGKPMLYWPPNGDHRPPFNHPSFPMIICEGELKAVKTQMAANESQIGALICGVPGTRLAQSIKDELRLVPMWYRAQTNVDDVRRTVYLAVDWNEKEKAKERGEELERDLTELLTMLGARVVKLRWKSVTEGDDCLGPQKIDEWLAAGGDLAVAMRESEEQKQKNEGIVQELWAYCNTHYCINQATAKMIPLHSPLSAYSRSDFDLMEEHRRLPKGKNTFYRLSEIWGMQPNEDRNIVDGIGFMPAPLGTMPDQYYWEDWKRYLNVAPYVPVDLPPWEAPEIGPFVDLVRRLCQQNTEWYLDYLAHLAQRPMLKPQIVCIFKDAGGTGKSALFSTLSAVFGEYAGDVGNALNSHFNSGLLGKTLVFWNEPIVRGRNDKAVVTAIKGMSGDDYIVIEAKHKNAQRVRNYGNLSIATNNDYVVPIDKGGRRWFVAGGTEPLPPQVWQEYKRWLDAGGIMKIRAALLARDLSGFDYTLPPPRSAQRTEMEQASAGPLEALLMGDYFAEKDIWTVFDIQREFETQYGRKMSSVEVGRQLAKMGGITYSVKINGVLVRLWAIRGDWPLEADLWRAEYAKTGKKME